MPPAGKQQTAAKPKPATKGQGKGLSRKFGGLSLKWWLVIAAVAVAAYLYYRSRSASSSTAASPDSASTATPDSGDLGSGGGISGGGGGPTGGGGGLASQLAAIEQQLAAMGTAVATPSSAGATNANTPAYELPTAASSANFGADALAKSQEATSAGASQRFGGVTDLETLPGGETITKYASGREVEQAPGKSAYVVDQGQSGTVNGAGKTVVAPAAAAAGTPKPATPQAKLPVKPTSPTVKPPAEKTAKLVTQNTAGSPVRT